MAEDTGKTEKEKSESGLTNQQVLRKRDRQYRSHSGICLCPSDRQHGLLVATDSPHVQGGGGRCGLSLPASSSDAQKEEGKDLSQASGGRSHHWGDA